MRGAKPFLGILTLGLAISLFGGCLDSVLDGHTRPMLVSINGGMPLQSDVFAADTTMAGGGGIPEDGVYMVFSNTPSQKFLTLTPADPYGIFIIDEYTIEYEVLHMLPTGAFFTSGTLPPISGTMHLALPVNSEVTTHLIIMPASLKLQPPIMDLMPGGAVPYGELIIDATITFSGHESGGTKNKLIQGSLTVLATDYGEEEE
jgi:hypothetical protein